MTISTPDLCDAHPDVDVLDLALASFGGLSAFAGEIVTIKCFEDNSLVKAQAGEPGNGRIMVVDGGGSTRRALLGDQIAANAVKNGWRGLIIWGAVRDVDALAELALGVKALQPVPVKTDKRGLGDLNVPVTFGGVRFEPGDWVAADANGVIRSTTPRA
ncbi:MAG: ribonuclease E activity regulator RraA [Pseudomonadota bacterium]